MVIAVCVCSYPGPCSDKVDMCGHSYVCSYPGPCSDKVDMCGHSYVCVHTLVHAVIRWTCVVIAMCVFIPWSCSDKVDMCGHSYVCSYPGPCSDKVDKDLIDVFNEFSKAGRYRTWTKVFPHCWLEVPCVLVCTFGSVWSLLQVLTACRCLGHLHICHQF